MITRAFGSRLRFLALAPSLVLACSDDPVRVEHDHGTEAEAMRLHVTPTGGAEVSYDLAPRLMPHRVPVAVGDNTLRVEWLDHDGEVVTDLDHFELVVEGLPDGMTFTPTSEWSGTLSVEPTAGSASTRFELYHHDHGHGELTVTVSFVIDPALGGSTP